MPKIAKPFLKWAGGKTQLLDDIELCFPYKADESFTFVEPFVGSGAVMFWVLENYPNLKSCIINDINTELVTTYLAIRDNLEELIAKLSLWEDEYHQLVNEKVAKQEYYYKKRDAYNAKPTSSVDIAALFIFLNRTCFNGLYRVNKRGGFNVPIGSYKTPTICDAENLRLVSKALEKVTVLNGDFEQTLDCADAPSFFYLDPPYKPLSTSSSFNSYAMAGFDDNEQVRLKHFCDALDANGYSWILSNSDVHQGGVEDRFFDNLYSKYKVSRISAKRVINSNASRRGEIKELLISNHIKAA